MLKNGLGPVNIWMALAKIVVAGLAGPAALGLTTACQTSCAAGNQALVPYVDGLKHTDGTTMIYETTRYDGEWLHFPSYRRFSFEHNFGTDDYRLEEAYISFSNHPVRSTGDNADVALIAGDMMVIEQKNANTLVVRNDTCSEQYLYLKLIANLGLPAGDAGAQ